MQKTIGFSKFSRQQLPSAFLQQPIAANAITVRIINFFIVKRVLKWLD
jgi:hypothetical protein